MKLLPSPDDFEESHETHRRLSENGLISLGVYQVLYGFRVRSGFEGCKWFVLDWCAGGDWDQVQRLYSIAYSILVQREENKHAFYGLPIHSEIKPFFMDIAFTETIIEAMNGNFQMIELEKPKVIKFGLP